MLKKMLAAATLLCATMACWAAVDVNKATEAELDAIKGVGPSMSKRIVEARKQSSFKDWADLTTRVKGLKEKKAAKLSAEGLTVNGKAFGAESAPAAKPARKG